MSSIETTAIVLLPIQPRYANAIVSGAKKVEFRKMKFKETVSHVVVYSSSPVKQIVGYFEVDGIEELPPQTLWRRYKTVGGIDHADFAVYYANCPTGIAIKIKRFKPLRIPINLNDVRSSLKAPQSYTYLSQADFTKLLSN